MEYLKSFVIGSSYLVFVPFFLVVSQIDPTDMNYTYMTYTFVAPLYFGLMNMLSLFIQKTFSLTLNMRYLIISIISATIVSLLAVLFRTYNYTGLQWLAYSGRILVNHTLTYFVIIRTLEILLK